MDNYWLHMVGGGCKYVHETNNVVLEKEKKLVKKIISDNW